MVFCNDPSVSCDGGRHGAQGESDQADGGDDDEGYGQVVLGQLLGTQE